MPICWSGVGWINHYGRGSHATFQYQISHLDGPGSHRITRRYWPNKMQSIFYLYPLKKTFHSVPILGKERFRNISLQISSSASTSMFSIERQFRSLSNQQCRIRVQRDTSISVEYKQLQLFLFLVVLQQGLYKLTRGVAHSVCVCMKVLLNGGQGSSVWVERLSVTIQMLLPLSLREWECNKKHKLVPAQKARENKQA